VKKSYLVMLVVCVAMIGVLGCAKTEPVVETEMVVETEAGGLCLQLWPRV